MRSTLVALSLIVLSVFSGPAVPAFADSAKVAKGTITTIGGQSLTVKVGNRDMAFNVDNTTVVTARGASTKSSRLAAAGTSGPHLADVLQPGQAVAVTYSDMAGALRASEIKTIPRARVTTPDLNAGMRSNGVITGVGADWVTINGKSGGGASFEQTFKVDPHTKVWAKGASKAVAATGGRAPFADLIGNGDHVSISYHRTVDGLLASDLHVTTKAH